MEAKKEMDKQIKATIISSILFVIVLIVTVIIVVNSMFGYLKDRKKIGDFLIDYNNGSVVKGKLKALANSSGMKENGYEITITNNGDDDSSYYLYVSDKDGKDLDENLMISLNNYIIKRANTFERNGEKYIIYEGVVKSGYSSIQTLRFWWSLDGDENKEVNITYGIIPK